MSQSVQPEFPAPFVVADGAAIMGQRRYMVSLRAQLLLLVLAGAFSVFTWQRGRLELMALLAGVAFLAAALFRLKALAGRPHRAWYTGRAAAESIKTLTWLYAVRGWPFTDDDADAALERKVHEVMGATAWVGATRTQPMVTEWMRAERADSLEQRKQLYLEGRILDQQRWYAAKSAWNARRARFWGIAVVVLEVGAAIGAFSRGFGWVELDIFGLAGAVTAGAAAWLEARQHENLAEAYSVAAGELTTIAQRLHEIGDEQGWGRFVSEAEDAISREHTLWKARTA